jgi:hypothetical protein
VPANEIWNLREGDLVYFAVASVYLPNPAEVLADLTTAEQLVGRIVHFSEADGRERAFAVVSLPSRSNVVVPSDNLNRICPDSIREI